MLNRNQRIEELRTWFQGKAHVYIDYANVRAKCKKKNWNLDFLKVTQLYREIGNVAAIKIYFGKMVGDRPSEGFIAMLKKIEGIQVITKPVKYMRISIDVSSIPSDSPSVLKSFIDHSLLQQLKVEAIEYLNKQLKSLNETGKTSVQMLKCNFDVEMATDMLLDNELHAVDTFCLWSGDSDFADPCSRLLGNQKRVIVFSDGIAPELNDLKPEGLRVYDLKKLKDLLCHEKQRGLPEEAPQQR